MSRFYFISVFLLLAGLDLGAQNLLIKGRVITDDSSVVANCEIILKGTKYRCFSNQDGEFRFDPLNNSKTNVKLVINDLRFIAYEKEIDLKSTSGSVNLTIVLLPNELPTALVFAGPQVVFKSDKLNVSDFEFKDNRLILLTYEKRKGHKVRLILTDLENTILSSYLVNEDAQKIERDFEGNLHLVSNTSVYFIEVMNDNISLLMESKVDYEKYLQPMVAQNNNQLYFSNYTWHYPGFSYFAYNKVDSTYKTLKYIEDAFLMKLYRAEYKYVDTRTKLEAYRAELRTGIDKEIWAAVWSGFPSSLYYKPLYAPMFTRNDSVLIFDHYSNQLYYFDKENNLIDSTSINYHLGKEADDWKKLILMDDVTKKIYNVFERNGIYSLVELNNSGRAIKTYQLKHKYPEKIKIHEGSIYYNYRPFESAQNKYLYKQDLGS